MLGKRPGNRCFISVRKARQFEFAYKVIEVFARKEEVEAVVQVLRCRDCLPWTDGNNILIPELQRETRGARRTTRSVLLEPREIHKHSVEPCLLESRRVCRAVSRIDIRLLPE